MRRRVLALYRARLRAALGSEVLPIAPLVAHGSLVAALCLLVRDALGPFGYALFALTASAGLLGLTLLGELGSLLRADAAAEWSEPLPARASERRLAHGLVALSLLAVLALGALLPAALFAPASMSGVERGRLVLAGLEQALALGASLLALQLVLGRRGESALVLIQTALVVGVVAGFLFGLRLVPELRELERGASSWPSWIRAFPPAWFASLAASPDSAVPLPPAALPIALGPLAVLVLALAPEPRSATGRSTSTLLALLLRPLRTLAERAWVAREERGVFALVFDALPLEREFVLRTYPMIGIPLAFLVAGAKSEAGDARQGLLALLLFTPAVYLPVLLAQVPATASPGARWILDCAPIRESAVRNAAIKALFLRFVVPLYALLAVVSAALGEFPFALRLVPAAALVSLVVLRVLYPRIAVDPPLSTAPDELEVRHDWMGTLMTLAVILVFVAIAAQRALLGWPRVVAAVAALVVVEVTADLRARRAAH